MFSVKCRNFRMLQQLVSNIKISTSAQREHTFIRSNSSGNSSTAGIKRNTKQSSNPFHRSGQSIKELIAEERTDKSSNGDPSEDKYILARRVSAPNDQEMMAVFPDVINDLVDLTRKYEKSPDVAQWFRRALEYNIGGKKHRGLLTLSTFKYLTKDKEQSEDNKKLALYLAWCVELLECYLIIDDILDGGTLRYNKPCWNTLHDVGKISINDASMIGNSIALLIKKYFSHLDCYRNLIELFDEVIFSMFSGELTDMLISKKNVTAFTMDYYDTLTTYKAGYFALHISIYAGMYLAGVKDSHVFNETMLILNKMAKSLQAQNDFRDCFSPLNIIGKFGTDIQEKKCTWLLATALQLANDEQKAILEECYGQSDPVKIRRVKDVYTELELPKVYDEFIVASQKDIAEDIRKASAGVPRGILMEVSEKFLFIKVKSCVSEKSFNIFF